MSHRTTSPSTDPTVPGRRRAVGTAAALALSVAALVVVAGPASAGHNAGVKWVDFGDMSQECFPRGAEPCAAASWGLSNTIYVSQTEVGGEFRYTDVAGTAHDGDVWLATELGAECRSGYRLHDAHLELGSSSFEGWNDPDEAGGWFHQLAPRDYAHGDKELPRRPLPVRLPVDEVLEDVMPGGFSEALLLEWGEEAVDIDVGQGTSVGTARARSYSATYDIPMHVEVVCKGTGFGLEREMHDSATIPLEIVWLGVGQEPGDGWRDAEIPDGPHRDPVEPSDDRTPPAADVPLTDRAWVTQAHLSVVPDPDDPCVLHLSGVIGANGETEVEYRFVDDLGSHSQTFRTIVDPTLVAMVDHEFVLEPVEGADDGELGFATEEDEGIGGLVARPTDRLQGWFQLEVLSPNPIASAVDSYDVADCTAPEPEPGLSTPTTVAPPTTTPTKVAAATTTTVPPATVAPTAASARFTVGSRG